jgi:prophage regulatory protein
MPTSLQTDYPGAGDRLLRIRDLEQLTSLSRATIYRAIKAGDFPPSIRIGCSARWVMADILDFIEARRASRAWRPN